MTVTLVATAIAGFGAIALIVIAVATGATERSASRAALRAAVEGLPLAGGVLPEDQRSFGERVVVPVFTGAGRLARQLSPAGYLANVHRRLILAGKPQPEEVDRFLAARVLTMVLVPVGAAASYFMPVGHTAKFMLFAVFTLLLVLGPEAILNRQAESRQDRIRSQLADLLDLLSISVEAGLGFEQALSRAVSSIPGALSEEFARMLGETRVGISRKEALENLDHRTDVRELRSFILALIQADTFGVSIAQILRSQADEMRVARRQIAQEKAQKAPVKMLFPLVFCILPALFVVVIGPAAIEIYRTIIK
ncbi:MAG TPA: type II secretion system F family protein [Acidimicrobiales bacterium]|nr:type II secretion system F family protein [Acidimicrobiales bacterium]